MKDDNKLEKIRQMIREMLDEQLITDREMVIGLKEERQNRCKKEVI